jgi:hypothetical protein
MNKWKYFVNFIHVFDVSGDGAEIEALQILHQELKEYLHISEQKCNTSCNLVKSGL